jgi:hypothetical protein
MKILKKRYGIMNNNSASSSDSTEPSVFNLSDTGLNTFFPAFAWDSFKQTTLNRYSKKKSLLFQPIYIQINPHLIWLTKAPLLPSSIDWYSLHPQFGPWIWFGSIFNSINFIKPRLSKQEVNFLVLDLFIYGFRSA